MLQYFRLFRLEVMFLDSKKVEKYILESKKEEIDKKWTFLSTKKKISKDRHFFLQRKKIQ